MFLLFLIVGFSCSGQNGSLQISPTIKASSSSDVVSELRITKEMLRSTQKKIDCIEVLLKEEESLKCEILIQAMK